MGLKIAIVGDFDASVLAHRAIPLALGIAGTELGITGLQFDWKHTSKIGDLGGYQGVWCAPASPYADEAAALGAIRWARESGVPFLGTCGGFQHAVLEFARNVLGLENAEHSETGSGGDCQVISRLSCSLVEVEGQVIAVAGTRFAEMHGMEERAFGYHCNFGLNPKYESLLESAGLRVGARDEAGEVRAMELDGHPFFMGTLFQPERAALQGEGSALVREFVLAASRQEELC